MPTDNHEASALMVDRATAEIMLSVTPELISRVTKSFIAETDVEILSRLPVPGGGNEYECSALECAPYIAQLNQYFERKVRESAEGGSGTSDDFPATFSGESFQQPWGMTRCSLKPPPVFTARAPTICD
jgi:hypothetical protein